MIAVEQQAKERLERLSALRKIKPVDMTKLSQQVRGLCFVESSLKCTAPPEDFFSLCKSFFRYLRRLCKEPRIQFGTSLAQPLLQ